MCGPRRQASPRTAFARGRPAPLALSSWPTLPLPCGRRRFLLARHDDLPLALDPFAARLIRRKAWRLIGRARLTPADRENLEQELTLRLLDRLRHFDPSRTNREHFTTAVVGNAAGDILRRRRAKKRAGPTVSLSTLVLTEDGPAELATCIGPGHLLCRQGAPTRTQEEQTDLALDVRSILAGLPEAARELAESLLVRTIAEACRDLGLARTTLRDRVRRFRQPFERAGLEVFS